MPVLSETKNMTTSPAGRNASHCDTMAPSGIKQTFKDRQCLGGHVCAEEMFDSGAGTAL